MRKPLENTQLPENKALVLSEIIDSVKNNYAISYSNKVQLEELQIWLVQQKEIFNK